MFLETNDILLRDGATGTELDRRGGDIGLPLWSARAIIDAPEVLGEVHRAYLDAGAGAVTTNTFRTHARSLAKAGMESQAGALTHQAVAIARQACHDSNADALVLGSVAPLEDCYSPDRCPDRSTCRREHELLIGDLVDAQVDLVLIETMCTARESLAAAQAAEAITPGRWAISLCLDSTGPPGVLLDGTPLADIVDELSDAKFIGINCMAAPALAAQVAHVRHLLPDTMPVAAYGNVGHATDDGAWVSTDAVAPERYAAYAAQWISAGARIIGGCCGTTPETTAAIREVLSHSHPPT